MATPWGGRHRLYSTGILPSTHPCLIMTGMYCCKGLPAACPHVPFVFFPFNVTGAHRSISSCLARPLMSLSVAVKYFNTAASDSMATSSDRSNRITAGGGRVSSKLGPSETLTLYCSWRRDDGMGSSSWIVRPGLTPLSRDRTAW